MDRGLLFTLSYLVLAMGMYFTGQQDVGAAALLYYLYKGAAND